MRDMFVEVADKLHEWDIECDEAELQGLIDRRAKRYNDDDPIELAYIYIEMMEEEARCAGSWNDSVRPDDFDEGDYYMGEGEWV